MSGRVEVPAAPPDPPDDRHRFFMQCPSAFIFALPSIALQRQRLESIVDDWSVMTDEEKKRVLQMIFSEIGADHTIDGLKIEFRSRPIWEPYVEAVLARQRQEQDTLVPVTTSERKTGLEPAVRPSTLRVRDGGLDLLRRAA